MSTSEIPSRKLKPLITTAADDIVRGIFNYEIWGRMGWLDVKRRYRNTTIGPLWTSLSLAAYVVAVGFVGSGLWNQNIDQYLPFLVSGMIVWVLISTTVIESCTMLVSANSLIRNLSFDYSVLSYALVWKNLIVFAHNLLVYLAICLILNPSLLRPALLLAIPGLVLVAITITWITLICAIACLRFRDIQQLVASIVQIAMLITPIFWAPDFLKGSYREIFVSINPLYHLIEIVRAPLLDQSPQLTSYVVVLVMAIGGWTATYYFYRSYRRRVSYWT